MDIFINEKGGLIVNSLKEALRTMRFANVVNTHTTHAMSRQELANYLDDVCIVAGDESIRKTYHELDMRTGKTIHIYLAVHMYGVVSLKYSVKENTFTELAFHIKPPSDDDYVVASTLSEKIVDLKNVVLHTKINKIEKVLKDQWAVSKQLELLSLIINEAHRLLKECKLVLALMDGSILPWRINLEITPKSKTFAGLPDEITNKILDEEIRLFSGFNKLFSDVQNSDGLVLVGAVKSSKDKSLHAALNIITSDEVSDQVRLADIMGERTVLRSFTREYRFELLKEKLNKLGIEYGGYNMDFYYIRKDVTMNPLKLEILPSATLSSNVVTGVPHLLMHMVVESSKHTIIARRSGSGFLKIPTLRPIDIIDRKISMESESEIVRSVYLLEKVWEKVRDVIVECAYTRGRCSLSKKHIESLVGGET
jgi:hypothetical protein